MSVFPPRLTILFSLFWLVFVLISFSDAAAHYLVVTFIACIFGFWGLSWLVRAIILLVTILRSRQHQSPQLERRWKLLHLGIELAAMELSLALIFFNIPLGIRLKLSESALTSYVQEVRAGRRSPQHWGEPTRRVGLFDVKETELLGGGIVRVITAEDFIDHAGLVYSPQQPPIRGEDTYRHLYGAWWHWERSW